MREVGPVLHEDLVEDHPPLGGPHLGHSPRQVHVGLPLRFVAVVLRNPLDAVHVDLELGHLPHHPGHEPRHVHGRGDGQARHSRRVGRENGRHEGAGEGDGRPQVLEPDGEPPVGAHQGPVGTVRLLQEAEVLHVEALLEPKGANHRQALQGLDKVGEDGGHGQRVEALELAAGPDVEDLHPQVDQGDGNDHQNDQRGHPADHEHGEVGGDRAHSGRVERLADGRVQRLGVPRKAVDEAARGLRVEEGHGQRGHLVQEPRVHRLGRRVGPVGHREGPKPEEADRERRQERVEGQVVLDGVPGVPVGRRPVGQDKVLPDLEPPLRKSARHKDNGQDQSRAAGPDVLDVHGPLDAPLAPLLRLHQRPG
mmetsp:Transcript_24024/g.51592  ORF Transcript_24024/g.51592 Transcript_24024/m.51592 type:complete len:366 (-) Transcript_24024:144-1241(-)